MVDADMGVVVALAESIKDVAIVEILGIVHHVRIDIVDAKLCEEFVGQQLRTDMLRGFHVEHIQPPALCHLLHGCAVATYVDELVLLVPLDGEQVFVEGFGLLVDEAEHCLEIDGHADGNGRTEIVRVEMLLEEDEHGVVEDVDVAERVLVRALAFVVQDGVGHVVVLVAVLFQAIGEVHVLAIHEIVFVESSRLVERTATRQEEGPRDDVNLHGLVLVQIAHIVLAKSAAVGEKAAQARHLAHGHPGRGQAAARLKGERAIGAQHHRAQRTHLGMGISVFKAAAEGFAVQQCVGIEKEDVLAVGAAQGLIVGTPETHVARVGNEVQPRILAGREMLLQISDAAIGGGIVHHEYLHLLLLNIRAEDGVQALVDKVLDVIIDNNDAQFHGEEKG